MASFPCSCYRKLAINPDFVLHYSTASFPSSLKHLFSISPNTAVVSAAAAATGKSGNVEKRAKPTKTKKAQTMARLINGGLWSAKLESALMAHLPLSQTTVMQTLHLIKAPSKALKFFNWAHKSGFCHTHHCYFLMLEILGNARHLNPARNFLLSIPRRSNNTITLDDKFLNSLIRSYGNAGLFHESIKIFKTMKSMGISPSIVTFNSLFSILSKKGRTGMVFELYDEMFRTYGVKPDSYTFNILIRGFCMNLMIDEGFRIFREMERFKCEPDLITYNAIVDGLCRAGKVKIAHNVIKGLCKKGENLRPSVVTYTSLIRGYCEKLEIDQAMDVLKEMVGNGIQPNRITYNTIIQGLCEARRFGEVKQIMNGWHKGDSEIFPDTCTFNTVINFHCKGGNMGEALKAFEKMKELKVELDSASYSMLIRILCEKGKFEKAEKLFDELFNKEVLLDDDGCKPIVAAYNPIFKYLCGNGKTNKAERVLRQLMKRGIQDPLAYKTLIMGHCKEGTFQKGHKLLVLMLRKDFVPDVETYESLIEGFLQKGLPNFARDTLEKMLKSSYLPRASTFHRILVQHVKMGSASESAKLVLLMLEKKIRQNFSLSTDTIKLLFRSDMRDKAFEVVRSLYENGYKANMEELIAFLFQSNKLLEAQELLIFSLNHDQQITVDLCSSVVNGLCNVNKVSDAFDLYYELLEKAIQPPLSCLEGLRAALEAEGRFKEIEFISKRMPSPMQLERSGPLDN